MSEQAPALAEVSDATRSFGTWPLATQALRHATCRVLARDRIAMVGRSGSGKSTLLHLLAGLDRPSSGSVQWPALGPAETLRPSRIGMVFQSPSLIPWLNVVENVSLSLQLAGAGPAQDIPVKAGALLARFELDHLARRLPEELSGGQAQRISLIRALVVSPELVLADEPTGQLDHPTAAHLIDMLLGWADETGAAVVVATHDPAVAARFGSNWRISHGVLDTGPGGDEP